MAIEEQAVPLEYAEDAVESKNIGFNKDKAGGFLKVFIILAVIMSGIYFLVFSGGNDEHTPIGEVNIRNSAVLKTQNPADFTKTDPRALKAMKNSEVVKVEKSENNAKQVVIPTAVILADKPPIKVIKVASSDSSDEYRTSRGRRNDGNTVRLSAKYMERLEGAINNVLSEESLKNRSAVIENTYAYNKYIVPDSNIKAIDKYDTGNSRNILPYKLPYLKVVPGMLILGHNSDAGNQMIAEVLTGHYKGARLLGRIGVSKYVESGFIEFTSMSYKDIVYQINAIAVDPSTNIPAIGGKVNKHWPHNIVYGFGVGFLNAYSAVRGVQGQLSNTLSSVPGIGSVGSVSVDTASLVQSTTADAASKTLSSLGQYRPPTYTKNAYTGVGLVFLPNVNNQSVSNIDDTNINTPDKAD
jgi:uncharacterized protein (UPF0333 family)